MDVRLERMADVLIEHSLEVNAGDHVVVSGPLVTSEFALVMQRRILDAGGHADLRLVPEELDESLLRLGSPSQLEWINPTARRLLEHADCFVYLLAPTNTCALSGASAAASAARRRARRELYELLESRERAGEARAVVAGLPTHALAQEASMSIVDYTNLVVEAGQLDAEDPVRVWREFRARASRLAERLNGVSKVRLQAEGTELTTSVRGRTWIAADGTQNFPDGEVYSAPVDGSTQGTIRFPHATIVEGRRVDGIELTFEDGVVVRAHADRGQSDLDALLDTDDGARRVGELAFGLNERVTRFTGEPLFDEKIAGTVHLALGAAYPECGGTNHSALHWDLVCDLRLGGVVELDGAVAQRDGQFDTDWF